MLLNDTLRIELKSNKEVQEQRQEKTHKIYFQLYDFDPM
jgi:hypothetical protein